MKFPTFLSLPSSPSYSVPCFNTIILKPDGKKPTSYSRQYRQMNSFISILITFAMHLATRACTYLSSLSENPLFSTILTIHMLLFLYFPPFLLRLVVTPVTITTFLLLIALLRSGSPCQTDQNPNTNPKREQEVAHRSGPGPDFDFPAEPEFFQTLAHSLDDSFVEWNVKAPLEVIYEEYEGEEDPNEDEPGTSPEREVRFGRTEKSTSLEFYYPETDSDTSTDGEFCLVGELGSPEGSLFTWNQEEGEGLIEIALDLGGEESGQGVYDMHAEEDNMIEIDVSVGGRKMNLLR